MPRWTDLTFDVKHSQVLDSRKAVENYYAGLFQIRAGKALRSLIITKYKINNAKVDRFNL